MNADEYNIDKNTTHTTGVKVLGLAKCAQMIPIFDLMTETTNGVRTIVYLTQLKT